MPNESAPLTGLPDGTQPLPLGAPATVARYRWPAIRGILALMLIYTAYFAAAVKRSFSDDRSPASAHRPAG